ncbi:hypothetical protein [Enterococcus phage EFGrKN]|uniref:Uncharacterized protein n=4 Tax=Schiekvirus TaxID=2732968 RepID=A0A347UYF9_9CAUD|nr:hypothetical protein AVV19_p23 [Enterococcus phage EFDG1]QDB71495.1 hypothetical protein [Enterococcus phage vB_OCPT_Ben]QEP29601.1 hypothetical protein PEf771_188 [Enterococcus phage PEf771]QOV05911.1 hypothetical protein [Enterococcus phage EFGrKN]UKM17525.1 hypothetical protein [Enterococcus phage UTI-EfS3]AXY05402.1 hypothetical protein [Enterococcus phage EFDG1]
MVKAKNPVQRRRGTYNSCDVLVEEENGFFYYSVLNSDGKEIIGGFRDKGSQDISTFYNYLLKLVDDYVKCPEGFVEDV